MLALIVKLKLLELKSHFYLEILRLLAVYNRLDHFKLLWYLPCAKFFFLEKGTCVKKISLL